jgi:ABC-type molybdate transport system substrate-binding protein
MVRLSEAKDRVEIIEIGVVTKSSDPAAALHFARYLSARDKGLQAFAAHQFEPIPDADAWVDRPRLRIFAGTMLKDGLRPVLQEFQEREGVDIDTNYNGCGVLTAEMATLKGTRNFPDVYVSCDVTFAQKVKEDFADARAILQNDMVFLVQRKRDKKISADLKELERGDLKVGMPHPDKSAMGKIFADVLQNQGIEPVNVTYFNSGHALITQMLAGALDLAVVGRSNAGNSAESREKLEVLDIAGPILTQTFQIAKDSRHKHLLERLQAAVTAPESMQRFKDLGFKTETP